MTTYLWVWQESVIKCCSLCMNIADYDSVQSWTSAGNMSSLYALPCDYLGVLCSHINHWLAHEIQPSCSAGSSVSNRHVYLQQSYWESSCAFAAIILGMATVIHNVKLDCWLLWTPCFQCTKKRSKKNSLIINRACRLILYLKCTPTIASNIISCNRNFEHE